MENKLPSCLCGHCLDKEQIIEALEIKLNEKQTELVNKQTELDNLRDSHEELWEKYKQLQSELLFRGLKIDRS